MKKILSVILSVMMLANIAAFQMVASAANESYATSLTNLITGGDMEGQNSSVSAGVEQYGSYQTADGNTYFKVASTDTTNPRATVVLTRIDPAPTGRKFRVIADVWTDNGVEYTDFGLGHAWNTVKASATINGTKKTIDLSMTYEDTTVKSICLLIKSAGIKSFSMDNAAIYDVTNAYKLTADDEITIDSASYAVIGSDKMTNAGDTVKFTVGEPANGYTITGVSVEGADVTAESDGSYTFKMPATDANIVVTKEKLAYATSFTNLVTGGDMEDENCSILVSYPDVATVDYVDGIDGKCFAIKASQADRCIVRFISEEGHKYAINANVKADSGVTLYVGKAWAVNETSQWIDTSWKDISLEHTALTASTWIWHKVKDNAMYLDNLSIYDITNAKEIKVPSGVTIDPASYSLFNGKKMTNAGDTVKFTVDEPENGYVIASVTVEGTDVTETTDGAYTFTMPASDANIVVTKEKLSYATSLENLVTGGDMEGQNSSVYAGETKYGSYQTADGNTYFKVASTNTSDPRAAVVLGRIDPAPTGRKFRVIADVWTEDNATYSDFGLGHAWNDVKASTTISGEKKTVDLSMTYEDTTVKSICLLIKSAGKKSFSMDNAAMYDVTNAYNLTADDEITIDSASYTVIGSDKMTNAGDTVKFTVGESANGYTITGVSVEGAEVTEGTDGSYTFTMPAADAKIVVNKQKPAYVTSIENLITGGDMEDENCSILVSYPDVATVDYVDGIDGKCFAIKASQADRCIVRFISEEGHKYAINADVKADSGVTLYAGKAWAVNETSQWIDTSWKQISLEHTALTASTWIWHKAANNTMYLDNLSIYDITNAYAISASKEITINPESYVMANGKMMTNAGDSVRFTASETAEVKLDGEVIVPNAEGIYEFEMPARNVSITVKEASLVNLIEDGDFEDGTVGNFRVAYAGEGHALSVEDGALKFTGEITKSATTALTIYPYEVQAGEKYYFTYKAKKGETDATEMFVRASSSSNMFQGELDTNPITDEFTQFGTEYISSENGNGLRFFLQAIDGVYPGGTYYIDDVELYNITDAVTVEFNLPEEAEIVYEPYDASGLDKKLVIDYVNNKVYTEEGAMIAFSVSEPEEGMTVVVEGATWVEDYGVYVYEVGTSDAVVKVDYVSGVRFDGVNYTEKNATLYSDSALSCVVIAATFGTNNNLSKAVSAPVTVAAGGTATIDLSAFDSIEGVKLFVWNNLTDIKPVIEAYTIPAQQ